MDQKIIERFSNLLGNEKVRINEPMNRHTTFRIGGPADYFLLPSSSEEVKGILEICKEESLQYFILGNGSNLLVSDEGYRGVIIQLYRNYGGLTVEGTEIRAGAGVLLSQIAAAARNESLTGFEFAGGIPGTLGGAVVMNAGAYGGELKDVLKEAVVMDREGNIFTVPVEKLAMGYRTSLVKTAGYLVLEVVISLKKGSQEEIRDTMKDLADRRISKQPLACLFTCAGANVYGTVSFSAIRSLKTGTPSPRKVTSRISSFYFKRHGFIFVLRQKYVCVSCSITPPPPSVSKPYLQ